MQIKYLNSPKNKEIYKHLIVWSLILVYINVRGVVTDDNLFLQFMVSILAEIKYMISFYVLSLFVFPKYLKSNLFICLILTTSIFFLYIISNWVVYYQIAPKMGLKSVFDGLSLKILIFDSLFTYGLLIVISFTFYQFRLKTSKIKKQAQMEKELALKELNFLKAQFHSKITFPSLNYCLNEIRDNSKITADAISIFSDLLKYTLDTKPDVKVPIEKEIVFINNFIKLKQLLHSNVFVDFTYSRKFREQLVLPRILITFIENAFKHGIFNSPKTPIDINLVLNNDMILLDIKNTISNTKKKISTGIGLKNVKQILELFYTGKHCVEVKSEKDMYHSKLIIYTS